MSFLTGWWKGSEDDKEKATSPEAAPDANTEAFLVDPEDTLQQETASQTAEQQQSAHQSQGGGVLSWMKGWLGWQNQLEVAKTEHALSETEGRAKATEEQKGRLWAQVVRFVGTDPVSMLSLPVWVFEPTSFLQRMAEPFAFSEFLYKAAEAQDPIEKLSYLAAFNVSILSITERTGKPFNPLLGETFEYISEDKDPYRFLAEQVSHHPPIGVAETSCASWICRQEAHIKTKFYGNSIDIFAIGYTHVYFPKTGDHFYWKQPDCRAHNILVGGMWVEYTGDVEIFNEHGKERCILHFHRTGWFGEGRNQVTGEIFDAEGKQRLLLTGKWHDFLCAKRTNSGKKNEEEFYLWNAYHEEYDNKWKLPKFTQKLLRCDPVLEKLLPPSDSRLRGDRRALEAGDMETAGKEKHRIEEKQRAERRQREDSQEKWMPKHFTKKEESETPWGHSWQFLGLYWDEREHRQQAS